MTIDETKEYLTKEEALARLNVVDGQVHAIRDGGFALIGADWELAAVEETLDKYPDTIEVPGPAAQQMNHGVAATDDHGPVFFETKAPE